MPTSCPGVPAELLNPARSWSGTAEFKGEVSKLARLFQENFDKYASEATPEVKDAGTFLFHPQIGKRLDITSVANARRMQGRRLCTSAAGAWSDTERHKQDILKSSFRTWVATSDGRSRTRDR